MNKQKAILDTAQRLFSQFGLKKVTTDDIAREARVSKATIYKYYRNKGEILDEVVKIESDHLLSLIREAVEAESYCAGKLKAHLFTRMSKVHDLINFYHVTQDQTGNFWPHIAEVRERFVAEEKNILKGILEQGNRTGELDVKQVDFIAHMIIVSLKSQEYEWATEGLDMSLEAYVDSMLDVMLQGIARQPSSV